MKVLQGLALVLNILVAVKEEGWYLIPARGDSGVYQISNVYPDSLELGTSSARSNCHANIQKQPSVL